MNMNGFILELELKGYANVWDSCYIDSIDPTQFIKAIILTWEMSLGQQ